MEGHSLSNDIQSCMETTEETEDIFIGSEGHVHTTQQPPVTDNPNSLYVLQYI